MDLHELLRNQDSMVQAAVHKALGLNLHLPLLQPQWHIYIFLQSSLLLMEERQLGLLAALQPLQLRHVSLQSTRFSFTPSLRYAHARLAIAVYSQEASY